MAPPVLGFSGFSGSGKTTLMEKVIRILTESGLRVGVVKHDRHGIDIDHPGKDSFRHTEAGAAAVVITSPDQTAVLEQHGISLDECLARLENVDLILVEGFRHASIPRIGLCRKASGKGFTEPPDHFIAVVTDDDSSAISVPVFSFDDAAGLADLIRREILRPAADDGSCSSASSACPENALRDRRTSLPPSDDFTHFDDHGRARMVDVGEKLPTRRSAVAAGRVLVNRTTFDLIRSGGMKKGDVLTVAQIAGIMAAKHTPDWIPMCHPVPLNGIDLNLCLNEERLSVEIEATACCDGKTGVEMEALTAVSCAALTVYDMCKAVQRDMEITDIRLLSKAGGVHGDYRREENGR